MKLLGRDCWNMINTVFPNAQIDIMDAEVDPFYHGQAEKVLKQFYWQLTAIGLGQWTQNKRDCDKAARLCVAYVIIRNALSRAKNAKAIGTLSYDVDGDKNQPHMINIAIEEHEGVQRILTLEPEGGKGLIELTKEEKESAWRASL